MRLHNVDDDAESMLCAACECHGVHHTLACPGLALSALCSRKVGRRGWADVPVAWTLTPERQRTESRPWNAQKLVADSAGGRANRGYGVLSRFGHVPSTLHSTFRLN